MEPAEVKIGLLNHLGGGNLGDDATLGVVMHNIRLRWPHAVITALSLNPDDTTTRHGIPSYPIRTRTWSFGYKPAGPNLTFKENIKALARKYKVVFLFLRAVHTLAIRMPRGFCRELWFLAKSRRLLKTFDLLIISGGGQLTEKDGPWAFPYTIFKWVVLAKSMRVRSVVLNVGAGPLRHLLSKYFVTRALRAADYVSFRDSQSQALAHEIGFTDASQVFPDSVYSLEVTTTNTSVVERRGQLIVGISPMPYCDPRAYSRAKSQAVYDDFISKFAIFASGLVQRSYSLAVFGTDIGVDPLAIADLRAVLRSQHDVATSEYEPIDSLQELLSRMALMDYVVTCRFHGVIFAHLLNKPVLAISPHPKVTNLMTDLGLRKYCVDIRKCDPNVLSVTFASLVSNADKIKSCMAATLTRYRSQLTCQFDELFPRDRNRIPEQPVVSCGGSAFNREDLAAESQAKSSEPHGIIRCSEED